MELLLSLGVVVILFGATRLPLIGKGLGEGIRNFRSAMKEPPQLEASKDARPGEDANRGDPPR